MTGRVGRSPPEASPGTENNETKLLILLLLLKLLILLLLLKLLILGKRINQAAQIVRKHLICLPKNFVQRNCKNNNDMTMRT